MPTRLADLPAPEALRAGGETLLVRRMGAGPPIMLLHGGPGLDHHVLIPLADELSASREVWLPDLPGHGRSGGPALSLRPTLERLARWVRAIDIDVFGGHSLGAWLARELMRERAVTPRAAVFICPPGPLRGRDARRPLPAARADDVDALREELLQEFLAQGPVDALLREAIAGAALRSPARYPRLEAELIPLLRAAVPAMDPHCPVLILAGALDPAAPPSAAQAVAAATRGATLKILEGAGHFPWATGPRRTAAEILRFLEERCG